MWTLHVLDWFSSDIPKKKNKKKNQAGTSVRLIGDSKLALGVSMNMYASSSLYRMVDKWMLCVV